MKECRPIITIRAFNVLCRKATCAGSSSLRTCAKLTTGVCAIAATAVRCSLWSFWGRAGVPGLIAVRHE